MSAEPHVATPSDDAQQQQSVRRLLEAVIRNAEADADRVAAFLAARGLKRRPPSEPVAPVYGGPAGPAAVFLLGLAAALRLHDWDRGGLRPHLPPDLPQADEALAAAVAAAKRAVHAPADGQAAATPDIPTKVLRAWFRHFAYGGRTDLGADVLMDVGDDGGSLLDQLAAVLWAHRRFASRSGKEAARDRTGQEPR